MSNVVLSIVIPTLNNGKSLKNFFNSLDKQNFSKSKIEILVMDGGSKDDTINIAKKHKRVKVFNNPDVFPDAGVNLGISKAKGKFIMVLAADNFFKNKNAISTIVEVFDDKEIYAVFPKHEFKNSDTFYTKYINTFTDPVNHFVYGYAANPRTFDKVYKVIRRNKNNTLFDFKSNPAVPMIAFAQGFTFRSGFKRNKKNSYDDTTPVIQLINENKKIAYLHSVSLYHHTVSGLFNFIYKQSWKTTNFLNQKNFGISHRVKVMPRTQVKRFRVWPYYSLTIIPPFIYAVYHLIKDKERLWIYHPLLCIISGYTSLITFVTYKFRKIVWQ